MDFMMTEIRLTPPLNENVNRRPKQGDFWNETLSDYQTLTNSELASIALGFSYYENGTVWEETAHFTSTLGDFEILSTNSCPFPSQNIRSQPISSKEWQAYFNSEKILSHPLELIKTRIFKGGVHIDILKDVYSYVLGLKNWNLTSTENDAICLWRKAKYASLKDVWMISFTGSQTDQFSENLERIEKDVVRTDRSLLFYARYHKERSIKDEIENTNSLAAMRNILMTYTTSQNEYDLEFVQGMADLCSPILYILQDESDAYHCFSNLMDRMKPNFSHDNKAMNSQLESLFFLIKILDGPLYTHLSEIKSGSDLLCCYRMLLILFKREFTFIGIQHLWLFILIDYKTQDTHLFVALAILETVRGLIMTFDNSDEIHAFLLGYRPNIDRIMEETERLIDTFEQVRGIKGRYEKGWKVVVDK